MKDGILIVNKPTGMTSHDVVSIARRQLHCKRVGHAGTLDPLATGVLVLLVGKATKLFDQFVAFDKAYRATLRLGTQTSTADIMGKTLSVKSYDGISRDQIEDTFRRFLGDGEQMPPMVSAVKYKGRRLYKLARQGIEVPRTPRKIHIYGLKVLQVAMPEVQFMMECSKGTYVRQLVEDIGVQLGCGACVSQIERTKVGPFEITDAIELKDVHENHIRDWQR